MGTALADDRSERFRALFDRVFEPLQRYVHRRASDQDAQDVVADTLLVLWRQLDRVPDGAELPWCYGIARRCLANKRRSSERHLRLLRRIAAREPRGELTSDPAAVDEPDDVARLRRAMRHLAADQREVLELWAWEQLEPREIAVVLGTTANAASIRLHRAKQRLQEQLLAPADRAAAGKDGGAPGHTSVTEGQEEDRRGR